MSLIIKITFTVLLSLSLFACNSERENPKEDKQETVKKEWQLPDVPEYQLENTDKLVADLDAKLTGLSIREFFDVSYEELVADDKDDVIKENGLSQFTIEELQLNDISDEYYAQKNELYKLILDKLKTYDRASLSSSDQISYDVYLYYLEDEIKKFSYLDYEYSAAYGLWGWPGYTAFFFTDLVQVHSVEDAEKYIHLLNQIGRRMDQIIVLLESRRKLGIIEPAISFTYTLEDVKWFAESAVKESLYYTDFTNKLKNIEGLSAGEKSELISKIEKVVSDRVIPTYQSLAAYMSELIKESPENIGFSQFEGGLEFYQSALSSRTTTSLTIDEVHELGFKELERVNKALRERFVLLGYPEEESMTELYERFETDENAITIKAGDVLPTYEAMIEEAYAKVGEAFSLIPKEKVVVIGGYGAFYVSGSEDGTRPGAFYASNSRDQLRFWMPTLTYHEAIPGHHFQLALIKELDLPKFRKEIHFTAFVEGWALYAEKLAYELGWYEGDIRGDIGRLGAEATRAARLVLDTGIHAKGWTYDKAQEFSIETLGGRESIIRYSVTPGQASSYMIGMLKILELRERARQELGDLFDLKEFHAAVIGNGSLPLPILENIIENYITEKVKANKE